MRSLPLLAMLLALGLLAAVALALSSIGSAGSKDTARVAAATDLGRPPPCFDSWEEAEAAGFRRPDPDAPSIIFITDPTPTPGPPFDLTKTPPPRGFESWEQVIDLWKEANDLGLFEPDLPPPTPEFEGPPPFGCSTWQEFIDWLDEQGIFGTSISIADKPAPSSTMIASRQFAGPPPPCFSSVEEMFAWFQAERQSRRAGTPSQTSAEGDDPPFNCESWEEFYQYMERRFPDETPSPTP